MRSIEDAAELLWRDGKIPEWIDISVKSADKNSTAFEVLCCGRYTAEFNRLYHHRGGNPPFHPLSPSLPPEWQGVEEHGKFPLNWFEKWHRSPEYWFFKVVLIFSKPLPKWISDVAWQRIMRIPLRFCIRESIPPQNK